LVSIKEGGGREKRERGSERYHHEWEIIAFTGQNWGGTKDQQNQQKWRGLLWATRWKVEAGLASVAQLYVYS
jgi:hypothetical protein